MREEGTCILCRKSASIEPLDNVDAHLVKCQTCGCYELTGQARDELKGSDETRRVMLSWITRERSGKGIPIRICSSSYLSAAESKGMSIPDILQSLLPRTITERMDRALSNLRRKSSYFGHSIPLDPSRDYPLLFSENPASFGFMTSHLEALGALQRIKGATQGGGAYALTSAGWQRVEAFERLQPEGDRAFIAIWFDKSMVEAYEEGVKPGIEAAGYRPVRVDQQEFNEKICDQIVAEIRRSRFVVADVTGHREAVYFEAGFAMGLGLPVIFTCKEGHVEKCSFDTRQYNHIIWATPADLRERLAQRIEATIGRYTPSQQ